MSHPYKNVIDEQTRVEKEKRVHAEEDTEKEFFEEMRDALHSISKETGLPLKQVIKLAMQMIEVRKQDSREAEELIIP